MVNRLIEPTSGADPHRRRRRHDPRGHRAPAAHRLRHPAGRPVPAPDDRRERRHRAPAARLAEGAPARARRGAARPRRPRPGRYRDRYPAQLSGGERQRVGRRPGPRGRPAGHAHGRALRRRRSDRPRAPPERVPAPPGGARQDDPVRDPRHRRGDQDGRPRRGHAGRRASSPSSGRRTRSWPAGVGVRGPLRRRRPGPQAALAEPASETSSSGLHGRPAPATTRPRPTPRGSWPTRSRTCCSSTRRTARSAGSPSADIPTDGRPRRGHGRADVAAPRPPDDAQGRPVAAPRRGRPGRHRRRSRRARSAVSSRPT